MGRVIANRSAAAIRAKLDELIRVTDQAHNQLIGIGHLTDLKRNEIPAAREPEAHAKGAETSIRHADRLIDRRLVAPVNPAGFSAAVR